MIILRILAGYICAGVVTTVLFVVMEICLGAFAVLLRIRGQMVPIEKVITRDKMTVLDIVKWAILSVVVWPYALWIFAGQLYEQIISLFY